MSSTLPAGVVTFLFTDVEGSTKLLHELGTRTRMRSMSIGDCSGRRSPRTKASRWTPKATPSSSRSAAYRMRSLQPLTRSCHSRVARSVCEWAWHTGEPRVTEEGYVGLDVHKGARIAAVGYGGQVLLSQATQALVDADVLDLGPHRLKDLSAPERIFQLQIDGLPSEFPPLKTRPASGDSRPRSGPHPGSARSPRRSSTRPATRPRSPSTRRRHRRARRRRVSSSTSATTSCLRSRRQPGRLSTSGARPRSRSTSPPSSPASCRSSSAWSSCSRPCSCSSSSARC